MESVVATMQDGLIRCVSCGDDVDPCEVYPDGVCDSCIVFGRVSSSYAQCAWCTNWRERDTLDSEDVCDECRTEDAAARSNERWQRWAQMGRVFP